MIAQLFPKVSELLMAPNNIVIFCEGDADQRMISMIIGSIGQQARVVINVQQRPLSPQMLLTKLDRFEDDNRRGGALGKLRRISQQFEKAIVVFDLEFGVPSEPAPRFAKLGNLWLAAAVPTVDSWILSDPEVYSSVEKQVSLPRYDDFAQRSDFWFVNSQVKRALTTKRVASIFSHSRAAMFSPSLRSFIALVQAEEGVDMEFGPDQSIAAVLSRLVNESYPLDAPIYRSLEGQVFTGAQMLDQIRSESAIGRKYASDLLRVSRDLLSRQASKHTSG